MSVVEEYRRARRAEELERLRRLLALRALIASGKTQREVADTLGVSQSAVSQQLRAAPDLRAIHPEQLLDAAVPVLKALAEEHGYSRLAVFGSVARHRALQDSDIDLLVEAPPGTSTFAFLRFKRLIEETLGTEVDLASYGGLDPELDADILREAVPL